MINYVFNAILVTKEETSRCRKGLRVEKFVFVEIALWCNRIDAFDDIDEI